MWCIFVKSIISCSLFLPYCGINYQDRIEKKRQTNEKESFVRVLETWIAFAELVLHRLDFVEQRARLKIELNEEGINGVFSCRCHTFIAYL